MRAWVCAYVGLGGNLGDAAGFVRQATDDIGQIEGVRLVRRSHLYGSAPIDASGPNYVNAVVALQTQLTAPDLLRQLQALELQAGRERPYRNAPRTLDLDLLLFGEARIESDFLYVPHPRLLERAFVLQPLAELAPQRVGVDQLRAVAQQSTWRISAADA